MIKRRSFKWTDINSFVRVILVLLFFGICGMIFRSGPTSEGTDVYKKQERNSTVRNFKVPGVDTFCPEYRKDAGFTERIFFIQTGTDKCLTPRYLCGVESAARANPDLPIYVYFHTGETFKSSKHYGEGVYGKVRSCEATELVRRLPNVHFIFEDLIENYLRNSTFWPLYEKKMFQNSEWTLVHLSDAIRLMMLNKHGGFYLDFDTVTLRPLHCLHNAFSYLEDYPNIENGVMVFDKGNPFLRFVPRYLVQVYDPSARMILGAPSLAAAFKIYCSQNNLMAGNYSCHGDTSVNLLHPDNFFPVRHIAWEKFYKPTFSDDDVKYFKNAYLTHIYMANWGVEVPKTSLYASLARQYCPTVWNATLEHDVLYGF